MEETKELITTDDIRSKVYIIRGQQVILDKDLAELYGYEVKRLNEQVKRNISRFPEDFMFQLNKEEIPEKFSKSQIATLNEKSNRQGSNIKKMPFAFTEQGIYMLATVLRGELAEQQSIFIMRTFREMRHYIKQNQQFVTRSEMELLSSKVTEISVQTAGLIDKQKQTDKNVDLIQKNVEQLSENFISEKDVKNFVIYKGQKLEADIAYIGIYQQAKKSIYVVVFCLFRRSPVDFFTGLSAVFCTRRVSRRLVRRCSGKNGCSFEIGSWTECLGAAFSCYC